MISRDVDWRVGTTAVSPEGRGRKPREHGRGASRVTADRGHSGAEVNERLMELVVGRENMMAAYRRVLFNKGSAGVDEMPVETLMPYWRH